jgi:large conductance mechanosensitive channel
MPPTPSNRVCSTEQEIVMVQEFRDFINRGNLIDIAVAFVVGLAFAAVITSFTEDIVNPLIAKVFTLDNLAEWAVSDIRVGAFLVAVINFLIVALVMFLVVRAYNRMREEQAETPSDEVVLLREIRDGLSRR